MATDIIIEDRFECTPDKLYALLSDNQFDDELMTAVKMEKKLVSEEKCASGPVYTIRLTSPEAIPAIAKKFTGDHLSYVETRRWNDASKTNTWDIVPEVSGVSVLAKGTTEIVSDGSGCVRKTRGSVSVSLPLIGKKIEEMVLKSIETTFKQNAEYCREYLKKHS